MRQIPAPGEKPLYWIGTSLRDLKRLEPEVHQALGSALSVAQYGRMHPSAKPWKGEGPGVFEVVEDFRGDTFRAVYTVRFAKAVYALHVFQKKSPHGIVTKKSDVTLIGQRLKLARQHHEENYGPE